MAPHPSALQQCFDEVADSAPMALERCLSHVVTVLQEAEGTSVRADERTALGEAWRELLAHQAAWCRRYPDELRTAFKTAVIAKTGADHVAGDSRGRAEPRELALVDDAEIMEEIESSRLLRHVMPLVEQPVSELDALVSSAMGLDSVQPDLNPVRPQVFAQSLRALISRSDVKPATGTLWMKYMAEPLGEELQHLYGRLVVQLRNANVQPADYRVVIPSAPAGTRGQSEREDPFKPDFGQPSPDHNAASGIQEAKYSGIDSRRISHALLREFLDGGAAEAAMALPAQYYADVQRELAHLRSSPAGYAEVPPPPPMPAGYRELPPVERPQRAVGVQSTLSSEVWGEYAYSRERSLVRSQLRLDATRVAQVLGLELVRKVVNQIAQDPRLLGPVREAIVALEPSLLRLAMVDPRFFSEEHHPGRLLMERVALRSFRYNDEFSTDFSSFFQDVTESFNTLNGTDVQSALPFEQALVQLEAIWNEMDESDDAQRRQVVDAMRFAEVRQHDADQIAWELSSRPDLENVPSVVQDFLFGPWSLVIAHARLTDTNREIDPHGYRSLISDLLWSVKREVTLKQPAQLFERVPRLVSTLRAGLASIGQEPEDSEAFFQALLKLHHPVLKLRRAKSRRDAQESGMMPLAELDPAAAPVAGSKSTPQTSTDQPWMSPNELDAAGFEETLPTDFGGLPGEAGNSGAAPLAPQLKADLAAASEQPPPARPAQPMPDVHSVMAALREGDWFDLYSKRRWLRAQLIWASSKATLFMFVSRGGQPHSMTKRVCERLVRERFLRPVRMHGVVSRALDTLQEEPDTDAGPVAPAT